MTINSGDIFKHKVTGDMIRVSSVNGPTVYTRVVSSVDLHQLSMCMFTIPLDTLLKVWILVFSDHDEEIMDQDAVKERLSTRFAGEIKEGDIFLDKESSKFFKICHISDIGITTISDKVSYGNIFECSEFECKDGKIFVNKDPHGITTKLFGFNTIEKLDLALPVEKVIYMTSEEVAQALTKFMPDHRSLHVDDVIRSIESKELWIVVGFGQGVGNIPVLLLLPVISFKSVNKCGIIPWMRPESDISSKFEFVMSHDEFTKLERAFALR